MTLKRVWMPSPCYSSRGGADVRLIVIHTAEGATTIESLGGWFANAANQVSSHTGADDTPGTVGEYVKRDQKAWTAANYNPVAVQIELCGFAAWTRNEWHQNHPNMLDNCAQWIKEESAHYGIPIVKLDPDQAQGSGRGVCQHIDLGAGGGGHVDCGDGFPIDDVLEQARGAPTTTSQGSEMIASGKNNGGTPHVFWVGANHREIYYRWKDGAWKGGNLFARTSTDVAGLSCTQDEGGNFNVFARLTDGNVRYTWQPKHKNDWNGKGDTPAGFIAFP